MNEKSFWERVIIGALVGALAGLFLSAYAAHGQVLGAGTQEAIKEFWGQKALDWFDNVQMHEVTKLFVGWMVTLAAGATIIALVFVTSRQRDQLEKKVEDEANEIKSFNQMVVMRLLEAISDQQKKDVFQTIAQGQAALWKPKE